MHTAFWPRTLRENYYGKSFWIFFVNSFIEVGTMNQWDVNWKFRKKIMVLIRALKKWWQHNKFAILLRFNKE